MRHKDARKYGWGDDTPWRAFTARRKAKNQRRHKGTEAKVKALAGYDSKQLDVAFGQVKIFLPRPKGNGPDPTKAYFFMMYTYIHVGMRTKTTCLLYTAQTGSISVSTFNRRVRPLAMISAKHVNLVRWSNRLRNDNHVLHFPKWITG